MKIADRSCCFRFRFVLLTLVTFVSGPVFVSASEPEPGPREREGRTKEDTGEQAVDLPRWGEGEFREGFDGRIWPERIIRWLERENLLDLIEDPKTPGPEKEALRKILAMQRAWPRGS